MPLWQKMMIGLARSASVTRLMQESRYMGRFARRFVGGRDGDEGLARARALRERGLSASLFYLGEYVADPAEIEATRRALSGVAQGLGQAGLDVHLSVDPTQLGAMISWDACRGNVAALARDVAENGRGGRDVLMLDMEDSSVTEPTLDLYHTLRAEGLPVAVTVQAYLHRTEGDLARLVADGARVRLVKGAFAEPGRVAVTGRAERDEAYRRAIVTLLSPEARERGVYPVFGTHDHRMAAFAEHVAQVNGWQRDRWEVEMLLGVRPAWQRELADRGVSVRLYLPFGRDWWPYSIRRVGENPANLGFVFRSMASGAE
ncbi:Proline dehydrogenase [Pseudodesulfovibrio mercurii]|uniref:Proline dehydrogenase n=1 Tax=Pseudodesulfovibrio mercurii TaxID=641491 RepID=F0JJ52_9BACT|nr:proline dehydrogenase family protein [Pseudodesulfovibrio mercurii]EGB15951.1 Proline dehydrogenase [Pseudodesulfovibrio mercurii]